MISPLRQRGALRQWELHFGPNMTPMVDVVMVILIFFMAGASVAGREWFLRASARAAHGPSRQADPFALPPARFEVRVRSEGGRVLASGLGLIDADEAALASAAAALVARSGAENVEVVVLAGDDVPYQAVVSVIDACAAAGVRSVGIGGER